MAIYLTLTIIRWKTKGVAKMESNLFGTYLTLTFSDIWPDYDTFKDEYDELPTLMKSRITADEDSLELLYYLYSAKFMNSHIANLDVNQFKAM